MRYALAAMLAGLLVAMPVLCAGDEKDTKKDAKDAKTEEKKELTRADQLKQLRTEFADNEKELRKKFTESTDPKEKRAIQMEFMKGSPFVERAIDLAKTNPKDEIALETLMFAIRIGPMNPNQAKVMELLTENHVDSPQFARIVPMIARQDPEKAIPALQAVLNKSTSKDVKGMTTLALGNLFADQSDDAFENSKAKSDELAAQALKYFKDVKENFGDVKLAPQAPPLAQQAAGRLFEIEKLRVGMVAPDIESELLDGKKAKLSDLRGKVVVLDIWATWCGPCIAMIPHEREMVKKLKDKPFELVSISADDDKEDVQNFLKKEEMPWTHWYSGPRGGIVKEWNVRFFPTIYVIDAKGVIRHKNIRNDKLEEAVVKLLEETK